MKSILINLRLRLLSNQQLKQQLDNDHRLFMYCYQQNLTLVATKLIAIINQQPNTLEKEISINKHLLLINDDQQTPLMIALRHHNYVLSKCLITNDFDQILRVDKFGYNALMYACKYKMYKIVRLLILKSVKMQCLDQMINQVNLKGNTILIEMLKYYKHTQWCSTQYCLLIQRLIHYGAKLNLYNHKDGNTPLILACQNSYDNKQHDMSMIAILMIQSNHKRNSYTGFVTDCLPTHRNCQGHNALKYILNKKSTISMIYKPSLFHQVKYLLARQIDDEVGMIDDFKLDYYIDINPELTSHNKIYIYMPYVLTKSNNSPR